MQTHPIDASFEREQVQRGRRVLDRLVNVLERLERLICARVKAFRLRQLEWLRANCRTEVIVVVTQIRQRVQERRRRFGFC